MKNTISNTNTRTGKKQLTVKDVQKGLSSVDYTALNELFFSKVQPKEAGIRISWETKREMLFSAEAAALYDLWMEHSDIHTYLDELGHKGFPNNAVWKLYLLMDAAEENLGNLFEKQFPAEYAFLTEEKED